MTTTKTRVLASALGVLAGPLALLTVSAAPANAAWQTSTNVHGGKLQVCRDTRADGTRLVRARLNNSAAEHAHRGGLSRTSASGATASVTFRAGAGRISARDALVHRDGHTYSTFVSDIDGPGAGGGLDRWRDLVRC